MSNKDRFDSQGRPIQRAIPEWIFGEPTLFAQGNGTAEWARAERTSILPTDQKSTTGWLAKLYGGTQTTWDDAGALYIPVNEMPLSKLGASGGATQWTYWMTANELFGCQIQIWVHDPEDNSKRADIIQSGAAVGLEKAAGWNKHILNKDTGVQFFYEAENEGSPGLITGSANLYSLADFQADVVFSTWTIYRISLNNGFYDAGAFGDMYVADVKINGTVIPLKPTVEEQLEIIIDDQTKALTTIPTWAFGQPTLHIQGNGKANWERGEAVLSTHQKGGSGWVARLYGGKQSLWDDAAEVYVPVHEMNVTDLSTCLYSWFQDSAQEFGLEMVIWMHDPTDFHKRAEATLSYLDTEKGSGWNAHELASTHRFIFYGENLSGNTVCTTPATNYTWAQYQSDPMFSTWTIYRISFGWGFYTGDGVFENAFMADLMINGTVVSIGPKDGKHRKTVKDTKALLNTEKLAGDVFSEAVSANGTPWSWSFGGTGYITKAIITHSTGLTPRIRLHLWDFIITDTEAELDDSDPFNGPNANGIDYYVGYIDFPAMSSSGSGLSQSMVTPNTIGNLPLEFNEHVLYGVTEALDTFTPTAAACNIYLTADMED